MENNSLVGDSNEDEVAERRAPHERQDSAKDVKCLLPSCCAHFEALIGLHIHSVKQEAEGLLQTKENEDNKEPDFTCKPGPQFVRPEHCQVRSAWEGGLNHEELIRLEQNATTLDRVEGPDELYVGSIFALHLGAIERKSISHILSMIKCCLADWQGLEDRCVHLSIPVHDVDDQDILVHLPRAVRFMERGLRGGTGEWPGGTALPGWRRPKPGTEDEATTRSESVGNPLQRRASPPVEETQKLSLQPSAHAEPTPPGAIFVHCAMGQSRSVTAVVAYLLWKYPHRYGLALTVTNRQRHDEATAERAVQLAVEWVQKTRSIAEPNPGFMKQLALWVQMGTPANTDDAVERHAIYQRWLFAREVEASGRMGMKPAWLRFEDDIADTSAAAARDQPAEHSKELRCKKCRKVLVNQQFVLPHQKAACPHYFLEPLSWMRPVLEEGELDGRLVCPNTRCGASIGRYAWQGFKCSCGEWVCPAFSLGASKVDEIVVRKPSAGGNEGSLALGIRWPPRKQNRQDHF